MANGSHTWQCPACGRQVPRRVDACHCGMGRERAEEILATRAQAETPTRAPRRVPRGPRAPRAPLPGDVKALLAGIVVVAVGGIGWLAFGPEPEPVVPVLGFVDAAPPPVPEPTPTPEPSFKLPWWK